MRSPRAILLTCGTNAIARCAFGPPGNIDSFCLIARCANHFIYLFLIARCAILFSFPGAECALREFMIYFPALIARCTGFIYWIKWPERLIARNLFVRINGLSG